jgi:PE family
VPPGGRHKIAGQRVVCGNAHFRSIRDTVGTKFSCHDGWGLKSMLNIDPSEVESAAQDLQGIGNTLNDVNAAAALPTSSILPAGADEVSAAVTALFNGHAAAFQRLAQQASAFNLGFINTLNQGAQEYVQTELSAVAALEQNIASSRT